MTTTPPPKTFPSIQGRCPACRGDSLFIGSGGWVTCSRLDCPNPSAADELLHGTHDVFALAERVPAAEAELERLSAGEEPGYAPHAVATPGQWLWRFNRASAQERLAEIARLLDASARGARCFQMAHEARLDDDRKAWVIVARVRALADLIGSRTATWTGNEEEIARRIHAALAEPAPGTAATQATEEQPCTCGGRFPIQHLHADQHQPKEPS